MDLRGQSYSDWSYCETYLFFPPVVAANGTPRNTELPLASRVPMTWPCWMEAHGAPPGPAGGARGSTLQSPTDRIAVAVKHRLIACVNTLIAPIMLVFKVSEKRNDEQRTYYFKGFEWSLIITCLPRGPQDRRNQSHFPICFERSRLCEMWEHGRVKGVYWLIHCQLETSVSHGIAISRGSTL